MQLSLAISKLQFEEQLHLQVYTPSQGRLWKTQNHAYMRGFVLIDLFLLHDARGISIIQRRLMQHFVLDDLLRLEPVRDFHFGF